METERLSAVGNEGERQVVPAMFVLFLGSWVLGNQAGFHCGVVVSRLRASGVQIP